MRLRLLSGFMYRFDELNSSPFHPLTGSASAQGRRSWQLRRGASSDSRCYAPQFQTCRFRQEPVRSAVPSQKIGRVEGARPWSILGERSVHTRPEYSTGTASRSQKTSQRHLHRQSGSASTGHPGHARTLGNACQNEGSSAVHRHEPAAQRSTQQEGNLTA